MQKGYKRNRKGIAVLYFFIGLIVLAIIVFTIWWFLHLDYSDQLEHPEATMRDYVEVTASPIETPAPTVEATEVPEDVVDISTPTDTPRPTATATPKATATPTPAPTPLSTPTPEPTAIPAEVYAQAQNMQIPDVSSSMQAAVTNFSVSTLAGDKAIILDGYGYFDDEKFDGANVQAYVVLTRRSAKKNNVASFQCEMIEGISGDAHTYTVAQNVAKTDFEVVINAASFPDDEYGVGIMISYTYEGQSKFFYNTTSTIITVSGGNISANVGESVEAPAEAEYADDEEAEEE